MHRNVFPHFEKLIYSEILRETREIKGKGEGKGEGRFSLNV
jgi:hypothetical protein